MGVAAVTPFIKAKIGVFFFFLLSSSSVSFSLEFPVYHGKVRARRIKAGFVGGREVVGGVTSSFLLLVLESLHVKGRARTQPSTVSRLVGWKMVMLDSGFALH